MVRAEVSSKVHSTKFCIPTDVSNLEALSKLEDKDAALRLSKKVNDAVQLLKDYNARLAAEMTERNKLTVMLKDFQREQAELLAQAELRLEVSCAAMGFDDVNEFCSILGIHRQAAKG